LIPQWARRPLVATWNTGVHAGRRLNELGRAIASGRFERCACCGRVGPMLLRPRSIPPTLVALWGLSPREVAALVRKETLLCTFCGAKLRARRMARIILETFEVRDTQPKSLREWAARTVAHDLHIAEINFIEGIHDAIVRLPHLRASDFGSDDPAVAIEDLTKLSYDDASFDVVLTSETLEHVPDLNSALAEIRRVLKPGGWHIFTVPVRPGVAKTLPRAEVGPPIAHPGGDWGYPVCTEFGMDLVQVLERAGFSTETHFGPTTEDDFAQVYASRKS
jgi:SAM-dependent methyltransferase